MEEGEGEGGWGERGAQGVGAGAVWRKAQGEDGTVSYKTGVSIGGKYPALCPFGIVYSTYTSINTYHQAST